MVNQQGKKSVCFVMVYTSGILLFRKDICTYPYCDCQQFSVSYIYMNHQKIGLSISIAHYHIDDHVM